MFTHLYQLVQDRAERFPKSIAFGGQDGLNWRTLDSRQVRELTDQLAAELATRGVVEGDRVVLWVPNHWRTPLYFFALWKLGAVVVPFDREMNPDAAGRIVDSVAPRLLISGYGERPAWSERPCRVEWWEPGSARCDDAAATDYVWTPPSEELAFIVFTSGTTGQPKGCMITHANLCSQIDAFPNRVPLDTNCRLASILPLSHLFEITGGLLYPFSVGAAIHYIPSRRGPDIVRVLAEQRITHMIAVPQLLTLMGRSLEQQLAAAIPAPINKALNAVAPRLPMAFRHALFTPVHRKIGGKLRLILSGGAALPTETQRLWERLGVRVTQGYGASECSPVIAVGNADGSTLAGSVGQPLRNVEVKLSPEGELLVKGPNVMRGYWQDSERTAEVMRDGWYATGDLASQDSEGNLVLTGRAKELIVLPSGMNVWPQDVEDVLRTQPEVADAVVLAVPTANGGVSLHAYLLPSRPSERGADLTAIVRRSNSHLAQHQRLAGASWWAEPDFPRTALGKVRRAALPAPSAQTTSALAAAPVDDDLVTQAIAGIARVPAVRDDQTLGDLGMDSLALVELAQALEEKTGKAVTDGDLRLDMTVPAVRDLIAQAPGSEEGTGAPAAGKDVPLWPYTWGRAFRRLSLPIDLLYQASVTRTIVLGAESLSELPPRLIVAGTHHGFADLPLVRQGLARTPARQLVRRLAIATGAEIFGQAGPLAYIAMLAFGLYPLEQYGHRDSSLRRLAPVAAAGNAVLIFPQG
ncbi:MAG TPA: non-ribosomal peptide synthetase, partial [Chloroflexota bacterium]